MALDAVDLLVDAGDFLAILGPSGCGKSSLLHCIAGLLTVDSGEVRVRGVDVTATLPRDRGVAMVMQNLGLYPRKSVAQNVEYPLLVAGVDRRTRSRQVAELLNLLGLGRFGKRLPGELSGGERQRVAIARALARADVVAERSGILLLDEPLSDLDAQVRFNLRSQLKSIHHESGLTTLFVTHDQEDALAVGNRIALMNNGSIVEDRPAADMYAKPETLFAASFLGRPPMNLFEVVGNSGRWTLAEEGARVPILSLPTAYDGAATLGVRPEELELAVSADGAWDVTLIEHAGSSRVAYLRCGDLRLACRVGADVLLEIGQRVHVSAAQDAHLFDGETGLRIGRTSEQRPS